MGKIRCLLASVLAPVVFAGVAKADPQFPPRKPGLWESTMTMTNMMMNGQKMPAPMGPPGGMVSASCVDPASDLKLMKQAAKGQGGCAPPQIGGGGTDFTVRGSCSLQNGETTNIAGTISYVSDQHVVIEMQMSGTQTSGDVKIDSVWSGACPAGVMPGDVGMMVNGSFQSMGNVNSMP